MMAADQDSDGEGEDDDYHLLRLITRWLFLVHYVGRVHYLWAGLISSWVHSSRKLFEFLVPTEGGHARRKRPMITNDDWQQENSEVRIEGLEMPAYLDNLSDRKRFTEQGDAITLESEVDRAYLCMPNCIAVIDHEMKRIVT